MVEPQILLFSTALIMMAGQSHAAIATGPLRLSPTNPRYFTDDSGKAVYLTGSHTWANLQDIGLTNPPPAFDFPAYLDFLESRRHNFIRLWRWEFPRWTERGKQQAFYCAPQPWQHPVGMTSIGYGVDDLDRLLKSPADWISPNPDHFDYKNDPPPAEGAKVIILDTDHLWGVGGTVPWVWKSFLRGLNPIWMDPWDKASVWEPTPGNAEAVRSNLGHARRFAERMNLAAMKPQAELASTRYCLANAGVEYLVYQPEPGQSFSVEPKPGTYRCEWFSPTKGAWANANRLEAAGGRQQFKAPFAGDAVLHLKVQ